MELTKQVVSLELSKRLKELGVEQGGWESTSPLFYWSYYDGGARRNKPELVPADVCNFGFMEDLVAAFTVAELGEMLPGNFNGHYCRFQKGLMGNVWFAGLYDMQTSKELFQLDDKSEADARAKMLIYLLENKLLTNK